MNWPIPALVGFRRPALISETNTKLNETYFITSLVSVWCDPRIDTNLHGYFPTCSLLISALVVHLQVCWGLDQETMGNLFTEIRASDLNQGLFTCNKHKETNAVQFLFFCCI